MHKIIVILPLALNRMLLRNVSIYLSGGTSTYSWHNVTINYFEIFYQAYVLQ
jgi:hypothetical protein